VDETERSSSKYAEYRRWMMNNELEHPRVSHTERDELIRQVSGGCDSQQELIEQLAGFMIEGQQAWKWAWRRISELEAERDEARQWARALLAQVNELEATDG